MKNIVYTGDGVWEFFVENRALMCYNPLKGAYEKVDECDENDFDVSVCENDSIYLMFQKNNSFYICRYNGNWQSECILDSNTNESYYKNIVLISNNNWLNAFYVLTHNGKYLLIHHILGSRISPEIIVESQEKIVFNVAKDEKRDLYIAYSNEEKIMFRKYVWKNKAWNDEEMLFSIEEKAINLSVGVTNEYKVVVALCCVNNCNYKIVTNGEETLISGVKKEIYPCIIKNDGHITCVFEYYGKMLESCYREGKWQRVHYLHCANFDKQEFVKISGPADFTKSNQNFMYTYGTKSQRGLYTTVYSDLTVCHNYFKKIKGIREAESVEDFADVKRDEQKVSEIIKNTNSITENDDTAKILIQIANRLSNMENVLSKVVDIVSELNSKSKGC